MSSGSESDEEYVPGEPEKVSEEDSADDDTELQYEKELERKTEKRKAAEQSKAKKRRKTRGGGKETVPEPVEEKHVEPEMGLDPEEEKRREEDLWAKFLDGTDNKPKPAPKESVNIQANLLTKIDTRHDQSKKEKNEDDKARERRIFEFAGETIVVENNVIKEKVKTANSSTIASKLDGPSSLSRSSGGLSSVLGQLNKKNKLSTLEKSKLDWETYKQEEGIEEEVQSHNKGKAGYLERKDFLERADLRQYEIERDLRMSRRSNR